jgi:hypothetical protein
MAYQHAPRNTMYYSRADNSWYSWWADGEPATIAATRMEAAYLELWRAYQKQGLDAVAAGHKAQAEVHSMTYWNAHAADVRRRPHLWNGPLPELVSRYGTLLLIIMALWCVLLLALLR